MMLKDDGDIIRAIGFVSVFSANLEDDLANLVTRAKTFITFKKESEQYRIGEQAKILRKELVKIYRKTPDFFLKDTQQKQVSLVLHSVEKIAVKRNKVLHSSIIMQQDGSEVARDRKTKTMYKITSASIYQIAMEIDQLSNEVIRLEPYLVKVGYIVLTHKDKSG